MIVLMIIAGGLLLIVIFGPQWWVKHTLARYAEPANRYGGSGAQLARHLLDQAGLHAVVVESTALGDHYDPLAKAVRLSPQCFEARSLTAITVAAHEVGHALQDAEADKGLRLRTQLAPILHYGSVLASVLLIAGPVLAVVVRAPALLWLALIAAFGVQLLATIMTLVTLPVEWNASFGRALPMLEREGILLAGDLPHARRLLLAAALTYVSASLVSILFLLRFLR